MLPTMNLQLTELTQFDTSAGAITPDGADEPSAVFADVLAVRTATEEVTGEALPPTGNGLPLLPDPVAMDPELSADIVLEEAALPASSPEELLAVAERDLTPTPIAAAPEIVELTLNVEPTQLTVPGLLPADDPLVTGEVELAVPDLTGKRVEPATPPGPVEPLIQGELPEARPIPELSAALLRDTAPQTASDASLRPILAAAAPPIAADPNATLEPADTPSAPVRSPVLDIPATRSAEPRVPVTAEVAIAVPETARPALEPLNPTTQTAAQTIQTTAQTTAQVADGFAEGVAELRSASEAALPTRAAAEPQTPRQVQTILQPINTPVQQPDWDQAVSERVIMMANNKLQQAEIRLTPAELGPLRVQVSVDDGAASVSFQAQHAMTREAIEQALPRLRELFAEHGLSLGQTSVGHEDAAGGDDSRSSELEASADDGPDTPVDEVEGDVIRSRVESGLVDTFV